MNTILLAALLAQTTAPGPSAPSAGGPQTPGPAGPSSPAQTNRGAAGANDFFVGRGQPAEGQESVRAYDVRSLGLGRLQGSSLSEGDNYLRLLPSLEVGRNHFEPSNQSADGSLEDTEWVNLLVDLIGRSAAYEGRGLDVTEDGLLLVSGPAALHQRVEGFLSFVSDLAHRETTLIVDVVEGEALAEDLLPPSGIVSSEEGARIAANSSSTYTLMCRPGAAATQRSIPSQPLVIDYSVEVASAAAVHDPTAAQAGVGTRLVASAAPAQNGAHVALAIVHGELDVQKRSRAVEMGLRYTGEGSSPHTMMSAALVEDPRWSAVSTATSCFLGVDQALVMSTRGANGARTHFVVRLAGGPSAESEGLALDGGGVVAAIDLGGLAPPTVGAYGTLVTPGRSVDLGYEADQLFSGGLEGLFVANLQKIGGGVLAQAVERSLPRDAEQWTVGDWLIVRDPNGTEPLAAARGLVEANRGRTQTFTVRMMAGDEELRAASLPIRIGGAGMTTLTDERFDVAGYDVEIAQRSMASDIVPRHVFDGLAVWLRPVELSGGQVLVETRGMAQRLGARSEIAMEDDFISHLERSPVESLGLASLSILRAGDDGAPRAIIGPPQGLHLVIEMN